MLLRVVGGVGGWYWVLGVEGLGVVRGADNVLGGPLGCGAGAECGGAVRITGLLVS
jgi:hypothetical protein